MPCAGATIPVTVILEVYENLINIREITTSKKLIPAKNSFELLLGLIETDPIEGLERLPLYSLRRNVIMR
jgi:hypothetical protein